jgi:DNA-binding protein H-NS
MDVSNLSVAELKKLQEQVRVEMKKRESSDLAKAREQIMAIAQTAGIPLRELMTNGVRAKTGTVAVRYRHPDDASQQWTGRGRQPKWVAAWVAGGKSIDLLRV